MIISKIRQYLSSNEFVQSTTKLITGTIVGQLIAIGVSPILTRIYTPQDFGILSVFLSFAIILAVMITWRYELAIMLPKDDKDGWSIVLLSIFVSLVMSIILLCIIFFCNNQIIRFIQLTLLLNPKTSSLLKNVDLGFYLYLIPLSTFFIGSFQVFTYWSSRKKYFRHLALTKIIKESSIAGTQLGSGLFFTPHPLGLIAGQIAGNFFATISLLINTIKDLKTIRFFSWKRMIRNAKIFKKFPLFTSWANLLNAISQNVPVILLFFLYSPIVSGFYAIADRVLKMPFALISNSVKQVYYQSATERYNHKKSMSHLFQKTTKKLALIGLFPFIIVILFGKYIFGFVFGESWQTAGIFASIVSPWLLTAFINPPSTITIFILHLNKFQLKYEVTLLVFRIMAVFFGYFFFHNVIVSIILLSIVGVFFNIFLILFVGSKVKLISR